LQNGLQDSELYKKLQSQDIANLSILAKVSALTSHSLSVIAMHPMNPSSQEIERLNEALHDTRARALEKDAQTLSNVQSLTAGLHALSDTFQAYTQRTELHSSPSVDARSTLELESK
jgi:hypothetical protein